MTATHRKAGGAGRVGAALNTQHVRPRLNDVLYRVARRVRDEEPLEITKPKPRRGPATLLTDEQVLEFRTLRERDGVSVKELARRFDVSYPYALKLSSYEVRSKLVPNR